MSVTATRYRFTRHCDEYAVAVTMAETTVYLGTVRRVGQVWIAYPQAGDQGSHLYVNEHRTRANAADALDTAMRAALAADSAEALAEDAPQDDSKAAPVAHSADPIWASGGPGKSAYSDYRWECACGHRYGNFTAEDGDVSAQHAAHLAAAPVADAAQDTPVELAPGMYRVQITVTNRDGVHSATEDMNPAAIALAQARPGWTVEILGGSSVTVVEDTPLHCSDCGTTAQVGSGEEEEAFWAVHGGVGRQCTASALRAAVAHTPRKVGARQWAIQCTWGCGNVITTARKPPAMLGCDRTDCHAAHNASVVARQAERAARPRTPRTPREIPACDWNMLVAFSKGRTRSARTTADPRAVAGTPENINARADARARGERAAQVGLPFDVEDRRAMAVAQVRAVSGDTLTLF